MHRFLEVFRSLFRLRNRNEPTYLRKVEEKIGYNFDNKEYLIEALTHRSTLGELSPGEERVTYERLEFLGDSVLALITSDYLVRNFPDENEGQLTKKKSLLVSKSVLSKKAEVLALKQHIIMSENALKGGVADQDSVQTALLEAVIGAIYTDGGVEEARTFIEDNILSDIDEILEHTDHINYKSHLQEWTQSRFKNYPNYRIRSTIGPEHDKIFIVEVQIAGKMVGKGRGRSKKDAEQMAAKEALNALRKRH